MSQSIVHHAQRRIAEHFDDFAPTYHAAAFDGAGMQYLSQLDLAAVARAAQLAGGGEALDVGVGTGRISSAVLAEGFTLTGVDASKGMLEQASPKLPGATLLHGSLADRLPVDADRFDLVTCMRVVKYLPRWALAISELARAAKPGGVVCFDLANTYSPARLGYPKGMVWTSSYTAALAAVEAARLDVLEIRAGVHLPDPLWHAASTQGRLRVARACESTASQLAGRRGARSWTFITRKQP
jgi:ubiquinone/menaquinone biosynthesis C-methylase UbiE